MTNHIRYAWGKSPFGDFIVAMSAQDLVAFEFPTAAGDAAVNALRQRFPGAVIEEDTEGLATTIATCAHFVDHPDRDPPVSRDGR